MQAVQESLLAQGSSLARHGVVGAVLIDAVPARGTVWTQPPAQDLSPFVVADPVLGVYLNVPAAVAPQGGGFTTLAGTLAPTPSAATFVANGWAGIEPMTRRSSWSARARRCGVRRCGRVHSRCATVRS